MREYRYYSIEPTTGVAVMELPLYGTFMDKVFSGAGNFTGTFRLGSTVEKSKFLVDGTTPGRYGLVCQRDGVPVWAGMLWSRTYAAESQTVQITGQTFESIFAHIANRLDYVGSLDDHNQWYNMLANMQTQDSGAYNFGIIFSSPGTTGILRYVDYLAAEYKYFSEIVKQLSDYEDGYGYTINYGLASTTSDTINKTLQLVRNSSALAPSSGMAFDYPGTISNYWLNESSSNAGLRLVGLADQLVNNGTLGSVVYNLEPVGWVPWHYVETITSTQGDTDLTQRTSALREFHLLPVARPTFELGSQSNFTGWNDLGKKFTVTIDAQDPRFPAGTTMTERLMGWSLTPESNNQPEKIRFMLAGES